MALDIEKQRARARRYMSRTHTARQYGITVEQRDQMISDQGGLCAICFTELIAGVKTHIDHCHETNKVRGILCINCNQALGKFKDSVQTLQNAIKYLESHHGV